MSVSVVVPVHNGELYVQEAIETALRQEIVSEVVVVNDHSDDNSAELAAAIDDTRVKVVDSGPAGYGRKTSGLPATRNAGVRETSSKWLYFLDADDRTCDGAIARLLSAAGEAPRADVIYGDYERIAPDGSPLGSRRLVRYKPKPSGDVLSAFLKRNRTVVGAQIVRRSAHERVGGFDASLFRLNEDWNYWCRIAAIGSFVYVPHLCVMQYRIHDKSMMHAKVRQLSDYQPAIDSVFSNPVIAARFSADELAALRRDREASALSYIAAEAIRMGRYRDAMSAVGASLRRNPGAAPTTLAQAAGAIVGI